MYATSMHGVQGYSAESPFGPWKYEGAVFCMEGFHEYWAPCMYEGDGTYYLYFSCREVGTEVDRERLYVASSKTTVQENESGSAYRC